MQASERRVRSAIPTGGLMPFEYRCVAGPVVISVRTPQEKANAVKAYEDIINAEARPGWEYVTSDAFQTSEPPGCFQGNVPILTTFKMLIFRRSVPG
jgi:hypothetical protein